MVRIQKYVAFALVLVAFLLVALLLLWIGEEVRGRSFRVDYPLPKPVPREDCGHRKLPLEIPGYNPTAAESNALSQAFLRVAEAYTNGSISTLRRRMAEVPPFVTNVADFVYIALTMPFARSFDDGFLLHHKMRDFDSVEEYAEFMRLNIEMARFLGDLDLRRGAYSGMLILLDKCVLRRLMQYRDRFRRENRSDMEARAEEFIAEWETLIESPGGFTRNYMRMQIALQHRHIEEGGWTHEMLFHSVRQFAIGLLKSGYKPKWLDEEYPPLNEEKPELKAAGAID